MIRRFRFTHVNLVEKNGDFYHQNTEKHHRDKEQTERNEERATVFKLKMLFSTVPINLTHSTARL